METSHNTDDRLTASAGSASPLAVKLEAVKANVRRYYDLCVLVREAKDEMQALNAQYADISADCRNDDAVEWLIQGQDGPAIREWEDANPSWKVVGNGVRKRKQNDGTQR